MKEKVEAICDECKKEFKVKMRKTIRNNSTEIHYFKCPHCGHRYTSFATDQECRKLQREIRGLFEALRKPDSDVDRLWDEIDRKKEILKGKMRSLKETW